jgi:glycosyltransferase involved in cell wall biosynthesis
MLMNYKIVIPVYGDVQILENCLSGIDVDFKHLLLVDNTPTSICKSVDIKNASVTYHPENVGVAKAWNLGLSADCDWTFVLSMSVIFPNGFSEVLAELNKASEYMMLTELGWHLAGISRKCVEAIGYFDENFYPAYYEDTDYYRRMCLTELPCNGVQRVPCDHPRTSIGTHSGAEVNYEKLGEYYISKWGGGPGEETYTLPFGDKHIKHWIRQPLETMKAEYGLEEGK